MVAGDGGRPLAVGGAQLRQEAGAVADVGQGLERLVEAGEGCGVMAQVDLAGSVPASERAMGRVATVAVNSFVFKQPVFVGDLVSFYAKVIKTGRTSITIDVEVFAQRHRFGSEVVKVTEAILTYVAIDELGKPRALVG